MGVRVRRVLVLLLAATGAACGSESPTAPEPAPSTVAPPSAPQALPGLWNGFLLAATCPSGVCGEPRTIPFVLRVIPGGGTFAASLEIEEGTNRWLVVDVSGSAQPDGSVAFTGTRAPTGSDQATVDVRQFAVRVTPQGGLEGSVEIHRFFSSLHTRLEGRIASASYRPLSTQLDGRWIGRAVIRACSGYCPSFQNAGDDDEVLVALGVSGQSVTGQIAVGTSGCVHCWLPVSGRVQGSAVTLSSERIVINSTDAYQLLGFEGSMDPFGRISGRFTFEGKDRIAIDPFDVTFRLEYEILWLKREL